MYYYPTTTRNVPIHQLTTPNDDPGFITLHAQDNSKISNYRIKNYRTMNYTRNPCYTFPYQPTLYDNIGISEGQGAGMNANLDSTLTRGELTNKTGFNLHERISFSRYFDYLPNYQRPFYNTFDFLVATNPPVNPQKYYNGVFATGGVGCRNYNRISDEAYRSIGLLTNETRKVSKYNNKNHIECKEECSRRKKSFRY